MSMSIRSGFRVGEATVPPRKRRRFDLTFSGPYFAGLLALTALAFWPTYLSRLASNTAYTHLHAFTATFWILLLIAQPSAVRSGNLAWHRTVGQVSYGLAPLLVLTVILLAHSRIAGLGAAEFAGQSYVLYLQLSLATMFALCYAMAMVNRRTTALHARFMVCTAFPLIDPVVVRLLLWAEPNPGWNYEWLTFGITDLVILALIWMERDARRGRWVFPAMLPVFVLSQMPALLGFTRTAPWQAFSHWFADLPLTR